MCCRHKHTFDYIWQIVLNIVSKCPLECHGHISLVPFNAKQRLKYDSFKSLILEDQTEFDHRSVVTKTNAHVNVKLRYDTKSTAGRLIACFVWCAHYCTYFVTLANMLVVYCYPSVILFSFYLHCRAVSLYFCFWFNGIQSSVFLVCFGGCFRAAFVFFVFYSSC